MTNWWWGGGGGGCGATFYCTKWLISCGIVHAQYILAMNLYVAFNFLPISENAKSFYAGGGEEGCGIHAYEIIMATDYSAICLYYVYV